MNEIVSICICTFRRPALFEALTSLGDLKGLEDYQIEVVVADNDEQDLMRQEVINFAEGFRFQIHYIHAPARNISVARNAALAAANGLWAAFIDDDEVADPLWLSTLLKHRHGNVAIVGPCIARYSSSFPGWIKKCDFHSNRIDKDPVNGYTSNVLLDIGFLRKKVIAFRTELGQTGGEDTIFFREIHRARGKISYCPDAVVYEPVVPSRANMNWVRRRKFRAGQIHGLMCREFKPEAFRWLAVTSGSKAALSFLASILFIPGSVRSRLWHARGILHLGALIYWLRPKILKEYG